MVIERVHAVFFSATGTTKRVVEWLTGVLAEQLGCDEERISPSTVILEDLEAEEGQNTLTNIFL